MSDIVMPSFSAGMESARVARWTRRVGEAVAAGDVIAEVETDKATMEIEAPGDGALAEILWPAGKRAAPVGTRLAVFAPGEGPGAAPAPAAEGPLVATAFRDGLRDGIAAAMRRDASILLVCAGASEGGPARLLRGLPAEFEARRFLDVEAGPATLGGLALGLALGGARPAVEFARGGDVAAASAAIAASAGLGLPILWRAPLDGEAIDPPRAGGLTILAPAGAADARRLTERALRARGPTLMIEAAALLDNVEPAPAGEIAIEPVVGARLTGAGGDVTIVSHSSGVAAALEVQNQLAVEAIAVRVVDLRSLRPLDGASLEAEARRSGAVVVVEPPGAPALAGEIARRCGAQAEGAVVRCVGLATLDLSEILAATRALCVRRPS